MNINSLISQPLDTICKTKATIHTGQGTEAVSQQRPTTAFLSKPRVVMCFTVMNQCPDTLALNQRVIEVGSHTLALEFLKQLGISPLHPSARQKISSVFPASAQTFQEKNYVGKFLANSSDNITPHRHRHLVSGIATKAIHAATTPS